MEVYRHRKKINYLRIAFLISIVIFGLSLLIYNYKKGLFATKPLHLKIQIVKELENSIRPKIEEFKKDKSKLEIEYVSKDGDIVIDTKQKEGLKNDSIYEIPAITLKAYDITKTLGSSQNFWFSIKKDYENTKTVSDLSDYLKKSFINNNELNFNFLGDIIPGRTVAKKMAELGTMYPFAKTADYVKTADLTIADLECPLSDRFEPPYEGMGFLAPSKTVEGLKLLGLDAVAMANNHSKNFGDEVFLDTLELLTKNNIGYFGAGKNDVEAHTPKILDCKGQKIAFLDYDSIIPDSYKAGADSPGVAWMNLKPWADTDSEQDIARMEKEVGEAKKKADFVICYFHWGVEYDLEPIKTQQEVAHRAIDAGADLIVGTHPHVVQTVEQYKGKFIDYSLGNYIFDQMWSEETREGVIMKVKFLGKNIKEIELVPYRIFDYAQPQILDKAGGQNIIDRIFKASGV